DAETFRDEQPQLGRSRATTNQRFITLDYSVGLVIDFRNRGPLPVTLRARPERGSEVTWVHVRASQQVLCSQSEAHDASSVLGVDFRAPPLAAQLPAVTRFVEPRIRRRRICWRGVDNHVGGLPPRSGPNQQKGA